MLTPLQPHTPRLRLRPATALDVGSLLRRLGFVPGYEADGGRWRVRQYRLPSRPSTMATP